MTESDDHQQAAVLLPTVAEAANRLESSRARLIDVARPGGTPGGPNLSITRVSVTYSNGQILGDINAATQLVATVRGEHRLPGLALPEMSSGVVITDDDGGALEQLSAAVADTPADVTPIVVTTWALAGFPVERRHRFFVATLYLPQWGSTVDTPHPVLVGFVETAGQT